MQEEKTIRPALCLKGEVVQVLTCQASIEQPLVFSTKRDIFERERRRLYHETLDKLLDLGLINKDRAIIFAEAEVPTGMTRDLVLACVVREVER